MDTASQNGLVMKKFQFAMLVSSEANMALRLDGQAKRGNLT
jgi:hypothetical protein